MSSGIAAPNGGRFFRERAFESARDHECLRLRRYLQLTTLRALQDIATAAPEARADHLVATAADAAAPLRTLVRSLSDARGGSALADLHRRTGGTLHDTTLQTLEYLASDGYGAELDGTELRELAGRAAVELRGHLLRLGVEERCELVSGLRRVVGDARRRGEDVHLITENVDGRVRGDDAAALVGAVREALNNARKHARAGQVVVRCEPAAQGARVTVVDDGVGVDVSSIDEGIGLRHSIFERIERRGGRARLESAPGRGTLVTLAITGARGVAA